MAVIKLFWENPYLDSVPACVTSVNGGKITVDKTVAFAFSGGQESDSGFIGGYPILKAEKDGKEIIYTLPENHLLKPDDNVIVSIDRQKRYKIMKLHFAAELVLEFVSRLLPGTRKTGANISSQKARIDFEFGENISRVFPLLENKIRALIDSDLEIISAFSDEENQLRYWEIKDFAKVPCGGTHIKRTSEIGKLKFKREHPGKNKERIEIYLS